jgi:hypothetical protein
MFSRQQTAYRIAPYRAQNISEVTCRGSTGGGEDEQMGLHDPLVDFRLQQLQGPKTNYW